MNRIAIVLVFVIFLLFSFVSSGGSFAASGQVQGLRPDALSKGWTRTWGGSLNDAVHNVVLDGSGNVYVEGQFGGTVDFDPGSSVDPHTSNGGQDVFLSKFDASGNFQWARTWGGTGRDVPNGMAIDHAGNVYLAGPFQNTVDFNPDPLITDTHSSHAGGMNNIFLSKFNPAGKLQWVRTWGPSDGGAEGYGLAIDASDHVYVVGDFSGTKTNFNPLGEPAYNYTNHGLFDAYLSKFDSNGNFLWAKAWGGEGYDDGPGVGVDSLGNVYVAGMYASKNIDFDPAGGGVILPAQDSGIVVDVFLSKFDSNGNFQWVRTWGEKGADDAGEIVAVDHANNVYVAGRYGSLNCNFNPWGTGDGDIHSTNGSLDAFVSKFNSSGTFQWARTWGGSGWDATGSVAIDAADNIYTAGLFASLVNFDPKGSANVTSNGGADVFFNKFDPNGNFQWVKTWGGSGDDYGYRVAADAAGHTFDVVGSFQTSVNFDPTGAGDNRASQGQGDAFLSNFTEPWVPSARVYVPIVRRSP